eukprot:TRINITY_DN8674_c0_g3_i1.p1 TRINITY_DN8674_c0_g3~~TRINITY_DN8674_c0_g3_i1.p1  ORF type:complete len:227 (+),score=-21.51 TRINITY_DN8674_c0_g3_i1:154-834(+)
MDTPDLMLFIQTHLHILSRSLKIQLQLLKYKKFQHQTIYVRQNLTQMKNLTRPYIIQSAQKKVQCVLTQKMPIKDDECMQLQKNFDENVFVSQSSSSKKNGTKRIPLKQNLSEQNCVGMHQNQLIKLNQSLFYLTITTTKRNKHEIQKHNHLKNSVIRVVFYCNYFAIKQKCYFFVKNMSYLCCIYVRSSCIHLQTTPHPNKLQKSLQIMSSCEVICQLNDVQRRL